MARGLSFRDRFFTPPVARATTSPLGILALGAGAAVGIMSGAGVVGAVALGVLAWAGRVAAAIPRAPADARIDPFTLSEPWRRFVTDALQARRRFHEAVESARAGPMRDRLREIEGRVDTGVDEVWRIARRGHDLVDARRRVEPDAIRREIAATEANADQPWAKGSTMDRTMESLRAQLATVERLERVIGDADSRLRLLNARLDEAAARTIELSVQAEDVAELGGLGDDVNAMVDEMEALRQAIEETGGGTAVAGTG
ncbi:MAG: hypothetical protein ABWZ52_09580 [Acidimicrobiales bacterium]